MNTSPSFTRIFWVVMDGVGVGALPDADHYGDRGANTLSNLSLVIRRDHGGELRLPHLQRMGLGSLTAINGVPPLAPGTGVGVYGRAAQLSCGKDSLAGHWEMAGVVLDEPFATYANGFPLEAVERWIAETGLPGVLGNRVASGTEILEQLGAEHVRSGKPILYTSADSVWQVAVHERHFGLGRLDEICRVAHDIAKDLRVGRVIARSFVDTPEADSSFARTRRRDYARPPRQPSVLDRLQASGVHTTGVGKVSDIFGGRGLDESVLVASNGEGLRVLKERMDQPRDGLLLCNLSDFDTLYGHRRDAVGFARALQQFDAEIPALIQALGRDDLLIITADHGNDPTHIGTDHTREYIPILAYTPDHDGRRPIPIGTRPSFADIGATVLQAMTGQSLTTGASFLDCLS